MTDRQAQLLAALEAVDADPADRVAYPWFAFLRRLLRERDLAGCYFDSSHFALFITRSPAGEAADKPRLPVRTTSGNLHLSLHVTTETHPVHRGLTEDVHCPPDRTLDEFDRLYARFLRAQPP